MKWSYSTHTAMRKCNLRLVLEQIVASHNAREPFRRQIFHARQIQNLHTWRGRLVHLVLHKNFLSEVFRPGGLRSWYFLESAQIFATRQLAFSRERRSLDPTITKSAAEDDYFALDVHERGEDLSEAEFVEFMGRVEDSFIALTTQRKFLHLVKSGLKHESERTLFFKMEEVNCTAGLDLVFQVGDRLTIVDWKVGEAATADYSRQLQTYAFAALHGGLWHGPPEKIDLIEVNLLRNYVRHHPFNEQKLFETEDFIYTSVKELKGLLGGQSYDTLRLDEFETAANPNSCQYCHFQDLCRPGQWEQVGMKQEDCQRRLFS